MKKIYWLFLLIIVFCPDTSSQSGQWGYVLYMNLTNNHNHDLKSGGSHTKIYINAWRNNRIVEEDFFSGNFELKRNKSISFTTSEKIRPMSDDLKELAIRMRADCNDASHDEDWSTGLIELFPNIKVGYAYTRLCHVDYASSTCQVKQTLYKRATGYADFYVYPKNINIVKRSPDANGISAEDKVKIEAPDGYLPEVYKWVYATKVDSVWYEPALAPGYWKYTYDWKPVANSSLNGTRTPEATLEDIYGSDYLTKVNFKSNTWIALEYDVYESPGTPKKKEYSNAIISANKLVAPHIISAEGIRTQCPGEANGKIRVTIDRAPIEEEIIGFLATLEGGIEGAQRDITKIDDTTYDITGLLAGNYNIKIQSRIGNFSANNVSETHKKDDIEVKDPDPITYVIEDDNIRNISCKGGEDGSFKVTASDGAGGYTLWWKEEMDADFASSSNLHITGLVAGTYQYYIKDMNGCGLEDEEYGGVLIKSVTLTEPEYELNITHLEDKTSEPSGSGLSNGYITIAINGGTPEYTVLWKNKTTNNTLTSIENSIVDEGFESKLKDIPAGTYMVTVTDSKGCQTTEMEIMLSEPAALDVTISLDQTILCHGDENASLSVSAQGGVPLSDGDPYSFDWYIYENDDYNYLSSYESINNLSPGTYKVKVTDGSNPANTKEVGYTISEPLLLTASATSTNIGCFNGNNGSITVSIAGGNGSNKLYYKEEGSWSYNEQNFDTPTSTSYALGNLTAGTYEYYIQDGNGCQALFGTELTDKATLTQPETSMVVKSKISKNPTGAGRSDGFIIIKIEGGIPNSSGDRYSVAWRNGSGSPLTSVNSIDDDDVFTTKVDNLPKGSYSVEIRDASDGTCIITSTIVLEEPLPLTVPLEITRKVDCSGNNTAQITARAKGGIKKESGLPYKYQWYSIIDGDERQIENQNDSILNNVGAGQYKVSIEDNGNPVNTASSVITVNQPTALSTVLTTNDITCNDGTNGSIRMVVTGGTEGYHLFYKLDSTGTEYSENTATGNTFNVTNLAAGKYSVYVKDANQCLAPIESRDTAKIVLSQPANPVSIVSNQINPPTGPGRTDGNIIITIEGGIPYPAEPEYSIVWKDESSAIVASAYGTDEEGRFTSKVENLGKGIYSVEIKDKNYHGITNGCYLTTSFNLAEPLPIIVTLEKTKSIKCFGETSGEIAAHAKGGVFNRTGLPYKYQWFKIENSTDILIPNQNDSILKNAGAGCYKVKVTDFSGLANSKESTIIELTQPTQQKTVIKTKMVSCFSGNDGHIRLSLTGGTGKHKLFCKQEGIDTSYREIAPEGSDNTFYLKNLSSGNYSVYAQDENLCYAQINNKDIAEITITQPEKALTIESEEINDLSGYNRNDGEIKITIDGGTPATDGSYTVTWKDSEGNTLTPQNSTANALYTSVVSGLKEGKYYVEIRDANFYFADPDSNSTCMLTAGYELIQPEDLSVSIDETHYISCNSSSDGEITARVKGGVRNKNPEQSPYKYTWYKQTADSYEVLPGKKDSIAGNLEAGNYRIVIEDYSRNANTISAVYQIAQPEKLIATSNDVHIICGQTASVSVTAAGGTAPYSYLWNTGDNQETVKELNPGKYMVLIKDARNCETSAVAKVTTPSDLSIAGNINHPICHQTANGSIVTRTTGGTAPYIYQWNNGITTKDISGIGAGVHTVVVTDKDGCTFTESFTLIDPEPIKVDLGEDRILCLGQSHLLETTVEDPGTSFVWSGPNGFHSTDTNILLNREGTYKVSITDSKGCKASDEIQVQLTDYNISSEIVVATDVIINDTVMIVNISSPEPDKIEWLFPENDPIEIVETTPEFAKVIFTRTGRYAIGIRSHVKDCYQDIVKTLDVLKPDDIDPDNFGISEISEFIAYPNPNDGIFKVKVTLNKQSSVRLRIFAVRDGGLVDDRTLSNKKEYEIDYQKFLSSGVYILVLETASGKRSTKMLIR